MEEDTQNLLQRVPAFVFVLATATLVIIIGIGSVYLTSGSSDNPMASGAPAGNADMVMSLTGQPLPDYVMASDRGVQLAYQFAVDRPDVMQWMVCYCGCGDHSGHKSALNCFVKEGGRSFDDHGSNCDVCVGIALDAMTMTEEGRSLSEIRTYIDDTYSDIGPGTDTPLPPA
jgi:hypothetical protein